MGSKKTRTTSNETATTTPNVPEWFQQPVSNYFGNVVNPLINTNADVLAPINPLMQKSYQGAMNLPGAGAYDSALGTLGFAEQRLSQPINMPTQQARLPNAPGVTKVAGPAGIASILAPEARQAQVGNYGPVALASDTSGLAGKDVATFGGASASGFLSQYMNNPVMNDLITATLAEYDDQAGREQAAYQAQGARNRAFGGSRFGIGEAQLASDLTRRRALTAAELRDQHLARALQAAQGDAANANAAGIASMQAQNARDETLADLASRLGIFNAGAQNDRSRALFDAETDLSRFNAAEGNDLLSQIFGEQNANARAEFDALTGNARQDAGAANDLASQIYSTQADMERFNVGERNAGLEFGITANQQQARDLLNAANARAGITGQIGDDTRANLATMLNIGNAQQDAQTQQLLEPYIRAGLLGDLLDPSLAGLFTGQTINSQGTSTSKQSGGLLSSILGGAFGLGAAAIGRK